MYDYIADTIAVDKLTQYRKPDVWLPMPLRGYGASPLTPFSNSVTSEVARRAVRRYYEQLEFEPASQRKFVQVLNGCAFLNIGAMAQLEAANAGIEPPVLRINGTLVPLAEVKKAGLFGGFKIGRCQKRMESLQQELAQGVESAARSASHWLQRTRETQWTQADVLQVMEEVERAGISSMTAYLTAYYNLLRLYSQLLAAMPAQMDTVESLSLINATLGDCDSLVEAELAASLLDLAKVNRLDEPMERWLSQESFDGWHDAAAERGADSGLNPERARGLIAFLDVYGHRRADEAEMAQPRWYEEPAPVMHALLSTLERDPDRPTKTPRSGSVRRLAEALDESVAKSLPSTLDEIRALLHVQSHSLHALAYVWAGTREWAKAAAHETVTDGRLTDPDDIFYFELEEIKQMMTGEWNISDVDGIRATVQKRRAAYATRCEELAPPLLIDDSPAQQTLSALPGSGGTVTAPLRRLHDMGIDDCRHALLGADHLSSGWALTLPAVDGYIARGSSPLDPCVVAARIWHRPVVVALGQEYDELLEGAQTTVDGDRAHVEQ